MPCDSRPPARALAHTIFIRSTLRGSDDTGGARQVTLGSLDEHLQMNVVQHVSLFLEAFKVRSSRFFALSRALSRPVFSSLGAAG